VYANSVLMRRWKLLGWCGVLLLAGAAPAFAQTSSNFAKALKKWQPGKTLRITLESPACEEGRNAYAVTISGDGKVTYTGRDHVLVTGEHTRMVTKAQVDELVTALRGFDFADLAQARPGVMRFTLIVEVSGEKAAASGEALLGSGVRDTLGKLATQVLGTSGAARWINGDDDTIPALRAEGWDFRSTDPQHASLLVAASSAGNLTLVKQLLALGAPVNARGLLGSLPLFAAIDGHHADVVEALLAAGADKDLKSADGEGALDLATELGYDEIAAMLKPDPPAEN
jgi:hypothetical protein